MMLAVKEIKVGNWMIDAVKKIEGFKEEWKETMKIEVFDEAETFAIIINNNWYWIQKEDWKQIKMV